MTQATAQITADEAAAHRSDARSRGRGAAALAQRHGALLVLVVVSVVATLTSSTFATAANVESILVGNAYAALLALGQTFVIVSGGIDLSVGSVYALGGVLAALGHQEAGAAGAILLPVLVCGLFGLAHGWLVARARLAPFIVTLAGLLAARGLLLALSSEGSQTRLIPPHSAFAALGRGTWAPVLTALAFYVVGMVVLQRTGFGQAVFAIGGNENAATLMGVPIARVKVLLYVQSAVLAGIAGMLNASRLQSGVTNIGVGYELTAIAAVVIGGTLLTGGAGSVGGTLVGVLLLAVIGNVIGQQFSAYGSAVSAAVNGGFLAVVVLLQTYLTRARDLG